MGEISRRGLGAAVATAIATACLAVGFAGVASAEQARGGGPATISAVIQGGELQFSGATQVREGRRLRVENRTRAQRIGPHTFSLVKASEVPKTRREQRRCFRGDNVCVRIAIAHEFDFQTGEVSKPVVERGKPGWDKAFGRRGDSFYSETRGETHTRRVSADAGTRLHFICAVHPDMHAAVKVR